MISGWDGGRAPSASVRRARRCVALLRAALPVLLFPLGSCRCGGKASGPGSALPRAATSAVHPKALCIEGLWDRRLGETIRGLVGAGPCVQGAPVAGWTARGLTIDGRLEQVSGRLPRFRAILRWARLRLGKADRPLWEGSRWARSDLEAAWLAGMTWLGGKVETADLGELSDLLQAFAIYLRSATHPSVRRLARGYFFLAARRYRRLWGTGSSLSSLEDFFDAVSALFYLRLARMVPKGMVEQLRRARRRWTGPQLLRAREGPWDGSASRLLDTLVDLYFVDAAGLASPVPYGKVVRRALDWPLSLALASDPRAFETQTYLATHIVYVLSDFEMKPVPQRARRRLTSYLEGAAGFYLRVGDLETLGEIADCLKILGASYESSVLRRAVAALLAGQQPGGDWGTATDSYAHYHTTWTALSGIMEYDLSRSDDLRP